MVSRGTPFWEWAVPAGGVLCWIWGSDFGEHSRHRLGKEMWLSETTELGQMTPVDVVLLEGSGPRPSHAVWTHRQRILDANHEDQAFADEKGLSPARDTSGRAEPDTF